MSYLLDKRSQRKKVFQLGLLTCGCLVLFYFRVGIYKGLSYVSNKIFYPVLTAGRKVGGGLSGVGGYFSSKKSLTKENENLKITLSEKDAQILNFSVLEAENTSLKEILGRKGENKNLFLAAILEKPNQSPYDTLLIDAGSNHGLKVGNLVLALGNVPVGRIAEVYSDSAKVVLFSSSGEKTQVMVKEGTSVELIGRGGGNFEMILPRDFAIAKGDQAVLPGISAYVLGTMETVISDSRDAFEKALFVSPVNIQQIKFVQVEL